MDPVRPLNPDDLCRTQDPAELPFETTKSLTPLGAVIGQARAADAVKFGIGIRCEGYNLFAIGPTAMGKHTMVRSFLEQIVASDPVPPDLCYVNNFEQPQKPRAVVVPAGTARVLQKDMLHLVEELRTVLPAAFESDEMREGKERLEEELKARHEKHLKDIRRKADEQHVALLRTPSGLALAPMKGDEIVTPDEFDKLPEAERKEMMKGMEALQDEVREVVDELSHIEKEARERIRELVRKVADAKARRLIDVLKRKYSDHDDVTRYLDAVHQDVVENVEDFLKSEATPPAEAGMADFGLLRGHPRFRRYQVNVLVDNAGASGAPIVYENNPTYQNLVGRVEHLSQFGALLTDFNLIKPGALHRANGGYLLLDAHQVLLHTYAWEGLKRALLSREVRVESIGQMLSLVSTVSLEPEAIPLKVKVVLLGERSLYYLLSRLDPELPSLFKVVVDFEDDIPRTAENAFAVARAVAGLVEQEGLKPFDRTGVARVIDHISRLADDAEKLSAHIGELVDLLREADYWAGERKSEAVERRDVERAIEAQETRGGRVRERVLEEIERGTYLIDTSGEKVGQINGLSVLEVGRSVFGRPSRITAKVRLGKGEVLDIEREVELSGPIHSKGVLILAGFLGARYAQEHPLSLQATLVFEQSYGMVEGDSASTAELCVLLSALAGVPLNQSLAVTGSVNQNGQVQAVGGVNHKIEGFFDVCKARGLTGRQGVLLPRSNVKNLMLRGDVVRAVKEKMFAIYPIETIDQAMELLTGLPPGERDASGRFPEGSINAKVEARLIALAERRLALGAVEAKAAIKTA